MNRRQQAESATGLRQQPNGSGRRSFLQQAGLAAIVVGGLETLGISRATAVTTIPKRSIVPASKNVGAVYPCTGRPGPDRSSDISWYCSSGSCGSGRPDQEGNYFWYDPGSGEYGGPVRARSNCATHAQRM